MEEKQIQELIRQAQEAQKQAYTPYSHFAVGAALLCGDGMIFTGCNVENAAYSPTNCAERTAVFKAVSEGRRKFTAIAIVGGREGEEPAADGWCSPCGVCRQVLMEFVNPEEFLVIMGRNQQDYLVRTLKELFPLGFGPANL